MKTEMITAQAGVPALLWSAPGRGKTSAVEAAGRSLGLPVETLILSLCEPADVGGLPVVEAGATATRRALPDWFAKLAQRPGILFIDELSTAAPALQAAALRLVCNRAIGSARLHAGSLIIAAANPPDTAAGGYDLAPAMANRWAHFEWAPTAADWAAGMVAGWPDEPAPRLPAGWDAGIPAARSEVAAFIGRRPDLLDALPAEESARGRAWPSRRTWDMVSRVAAAHRAAGVDDAQAVAGLVGEGAALEFLAWRKALDLPSAADVLAGRAKVPDRDDRAFAVLGAVAGLGCQEAKHWPAALGVVVAHANGGRADIAAPAARALLQRAPADWLKLISKATRDGLQTLLPTLQAAGLAGGAK